MPANFRVPRFIGWLYDLAGVLIASIVQFLLSVGIIVSSVSKNKKNDFMLRKILMGYYPHCVYCKIFLDYYK